MSRTVRTNWAPRVLSKRPILISSGQRAAFSTASGPALRTVSATVCFQRPGRSLDVGIDGRSAAAVLAAAVAEFLGDLGGATGLLTNMRQMGMADVSSQCSPGMRQVPVWQQPDVPVGARTFGPESTTPPWHPEPPGDRLRPVARGLGGECACFASTATGVMFKNFTAGTRVADDPLAWRDC